MLIYWFVLFCAVSIGLLNDQYSTYIKIKQETYQRRWNIFGILFLLIIISVSALRYKVGADYGQYVWNFNNWYIKANLSFNDWKNEPGIVVLAKLFNVLCPNGNLFISFVSVLTLTICLSIVNRESHKTWFSFSLFILLGIWASSFNGIRQYLASAIIFGGYRCIIEERLKYWCFIVALASLFHMTAWIILPIYFIARRNADLKQVLLCAFFSVALLSFYDTIWGLVETLKGDVNENSIYASHGINIFRVLCSWVPVILYIGFRDRGIILSAKENFFINMSVINASLMTIASNSAYLGRVCIYTNIFNVIAIPIIVDNLKTQNKSMIYIVLFLFYLLYWMYSLKVSVGLEYHSLFELWSR